MKSIGDLGEDIVCDWLNTQKFKILHRNWRTKWCEIDIIAKKANVIYFIEVKFRSSDEAGSGMEYITKNKQKQMRFAAEIWMQNHNYSGDALLSAASVDSQKRVIFIDNID